MVVRAHEWHAKRVVAVRKSTQQASSTPPWRQQAKSAPQVTVSCRRSPAKSAGPTTSPFDAFTRSAALPHPTQAMPWSVTTTVAAVTTMQGCQGNDVWSETQTNRSHNSHGWNDASSWWSEGEQHEHTAQTEQTPAQSPWHLESVRLRAAFAESIARAQTEQTALESMPHPQTEHTALESMPHAQTEPGFSGGGSQETALESMASAQTEQTELESMAPRTSNAAQQLEAVHRLVMRNGAHQVQEQEQVQDQVHSGSGPGAGGDGDSKEQVPNGDIIFCFYRSNQAWSGSCGEIGAVLSWATGEIRLPSGRFSACRVQSTRQLRATSRSTDQRTTARWQIKRQWTCIGKSSSSSTTSSTCSSSSSCSSHRRRQRRRHQRPIRRQQARPCLRQDPANCRRLWTSQGWPSSCFGQRLS